MMTLKPFRKITVVNDAGIKRKFLADTATAMEKHFKQSLHGQKSGRLYRYRGRSHRASAPGQYPANMSGALEQSISSSSNSNQAVVGSNTGYSNYLAEGTTRMEARSMSKEALQEIVPTMLSKLRSWVRFNRA